MDNLRVPGEQRHLAGRELGAWAWVALAVIYATSAYTDLSRYLNPTGEKYIPDYEQGGQLDFSYAYLGTRAMLAHENPYTTPSPIYTHPIFKPELIGTKLYKQLYPPGQLITYIPLALLFGPDAVSAGRVFFHISLLCLVALGTLTWWLLAEARAEPLTPLFIFVATACFATHPGVQLGLERGQSDVLSAVLCWSAVAAFCRRSFGLAFFLMTWAASIKVYPVLLAVWLGVLAIRSDVWRPALLGLAVGLLLFLLPAAGYLGDAFTGAFHRANMYWPYWFNHGFKNFVVCLISPEASDNGRTALSLAALAVTALWAWRSWQHRRGGPPRLTPALVLFATAALATSIGFSALSVIYDLVLLLPGLVFLAAFQGRVVEDFGIGRVGRHALGAAIAFAGFALMLCRWGPDFPFATFGVLTLLGILAWLAIKMPAPAPAER